MNADAVRIEVLQQVLEHTPEGPARVRRLDALARAQERERRRFEPMKLTTSERRFLLSATTKDETRPLLHRPFVDEALGNRYLVATNGHRVHALALEAEELKDWKPGTIVDIAKTGEVERFETKLKPPQTGYVWPKPREAATIDVELFRAVASAKHAKCQLVFELGVPTPVPVLYVAHGAYAHIGAGNAIGLNTGYVTDALALAGKVVDDKHGKGEIRPEALIEASDAHSVVLIRPLGDGRWRSLIMPLRIL